MNKNTLKHESQWLMSALAAVHRSTPTDRPTDRLDTSAAAIIY